MKVVVNKCYGGFGLSETAMYRYAELRGITLYPEKESSLFTIYWTVPAGDERENSYAENTLYDGDIPRDDPILIQVVDELGDKASGDCARLDVVEVPDGVDWEIEEYDGMEWVAEKHRTW